jgi:hypothetical protein
MPTLAQLKQPYRATPADRFGFILAYLRLVAARWQAEDLTLSPVDRPVAWKGLRAEGVGEPILQWMLFQAHVEHLRLASEPGTYPACFETVHTVCLLANSYFALTQRGEEFADHFLADLMSAREDPFGNEWDPLILGTLAPRYDVSARSFSWGWHVLKHFRQPSSNQEVILRTADELEWATWFDNPLPPATDRNPKTCLNYAIKALNRYQSPYLVHFQGDGTGTRIGWQLR